jgi:uncharacterized membrane protein
MTNQIFLHYLSLALAIMLGAILRFWNLDFKPLWMDEVITSIFSLGKNYHDVPVEVLFPLARLQEIFTYQSGLSCASIAENVAKMSTHPPLFFCWMYTWLGWLGADKQNLVAKMRSLPAIFGVCAIPVIYGVNRIAFSKIVVMAVSPFAVYLSQEARHYTLPMLLISLALLGLVQIQQDILKNKINYWVWLLWTIINCIGLYTHYFFILALVAEIVTLIILIFSQIKNREQRKFWLALILSISVIFISFFPWIPIMLSHFNRSETEWLPSHNGIAPIYQTLINWILMVIALPVETQFLPITIICGLLMLIFGIWTGWNIFKGLKNLWNTNKTHLPTLTLLTFSVCILLEFLVIIYFLGKDITVAPRYNFVYYPSFCALIAASLTINNPLRISLKLRLFFIVGTLSCICVIYNLILLKPFQPEVVAKKINLEPSTPLMVVVRYRNYQDIASGLSFTLALEKIRDYTSANPKLSSNVAFLKDSPELSGTWQKIGQLPPPSSKFNLWVIAPGLVRASYPDNITLDQTNCLKDPQHYHRIGIPYQLFRCGAITSTDMHRFIKISSTP